MDPRKRFHRNRAWALLSLLLIASVLLAACGGDDDDDDTSGTGDATATTGVVEPTEAEAEDTEETDASASPEAEATTDGSAGGESAWYIDNFPGPVQEGGMLTYLLYEDPDSLNPLIGQTSIAVQVSLTIIEGLTQNAPDGSFEPVLATELPTVENGGISEDLLVVTWKLREGVLWHDGEAFTAADVIHTWQAATSVEGGSAVATKYEFIESVEAPDDLTVVVTYSQFFPGYLDQFDWIVPEHATGDPADMLEWDFNRAPIGTGPYVFAEWESGSSVTVTKNDDYWQEGKPYLDGINFLIVPAEEARTAQMVEGDAQIMLWPGQAATDEIEASGNAMERLAPGIWVDQLRFNLSKPYDDDPGVEPPHPILGDVRVREAITMAIDRNRINHEILDVLDIDSPLAVGWINCEVEPFVFDPDAAKALLEEAGWVDPDGDGVREASGALYAEDGTKMELSMNGYTGFESNELAELAIQEDLAAVGIKVNIEDQDFAVIFGTWEDASPRLVGDYDMLFYDSGFFAEPHDAIRSNYHPSQVPSAENPAGDNVTRWVREDVGEWIDAAGSTPDVDVRRENYCKVADAIREDIPVFPVLQFGEGSAYSVKLHGFTVSTWEYSTWDAENWWMEQ